MQMTYSFSTKGIHTQSSYYPLICKSLEIHRGFKLTGWSRLFIWLGLTPRQRLIYLSLVFRRVSYLSDTSGFHWSLSAYGFSDYHPLLDSLTWQINICQRRHYYMLSRRNLLLKCFRVLSAFGYLSCHSRRESLTVSISSVGIFCGLLNTLSNVGGYM